MDASAVCLSCGQKVAVGEELCSSCRTVRVPLPEGDLFETASNAAASGPPPFPLSTRLIGARRPLEELLAAFDRVRAGCGLAFVALEGPAGAGKSRLLHELAEAVAERDPAARVHAASAGDASVPYGPFVRVLGARLGLAPAAGPDEARAKVTAAVADLLPEASQLEAAHLLAHLLGAGFSDSPVVEPLADSPAKLEARAFLAVRRFLGADAARAPLVLCIDEAEQAGPETVKLLHYLAAGLSSARLLLVAAGRPQAEAAALRPPSEGLPFERVALAPLATSEADDLLRLLLAPAGATPERLLAHVRRAPRTPRAIVELVRLLVEAGVVVARRGHWSFDGARLAAFELPQRDTETLSARLALLPAGDRDLLAKAAVCGERFWLDALVALQRAETLDSGDPDGPTLAEIAATGDRTRAATAEGLARLAERGWIVDDEARVAGAREHRFAYAPLRELVLASMDPEVKRRHQRWVAQWLELRPDGREEDAQEEIGRHLEASGDGDAAAACFRRAADGARRRFFNEKAIRLYARALRCATRGNLAARIHLWHDLGSVYELKGDFESALGSYERMLRLSWVASSRSKAAVAFNKLGRVWRRKGNLKPALDYLERGLSLFEQAGDGRGVAASLDDIGSVLYLLGRYDEAHAKITRALARRGKDGDKRSIAHSLSDLGHVQKDRGKLDEAQACYAQALELRREIGDRAGMVSSMQSLAALAFERRQIDEARRAFEEALDDAERIGALPLTAQLLCHLGQVALAQGKTEEARRRLQDALATARELDDRRLTSDASRSLALVELAGGDHARARELSQAALQIAGEAGLRDGVGRALLAAGEVAATTLVDDSGGGTDGGAGSDRARADDLFARGVAVFREIGHTTELARGLARHGRHRVEIGDLAGGRVLLAEARGIFQQLGLPTTGVIPEV